MVEDLLITLNYQITPNTFQRMNKTEKKMTTVVDACTGKVIEGTSVEKRLFRLCALQAAAAARKREAEFACFGWGPCACVWSEPKMLEWVALTDQTNSPPGVAFREAETAWSLSGITDS